MEVCSKEEPTVSNKNTWRHRGRLKEYRKLELREAIERNGDMFHINVKCKIILSLTKKVCYLKVKYVTWIYHKAHKLVISSVFFFFCIIAKPKNKSPSKLDKMFPFLCKPKTKCGREGEGKGGFLSAESCCCSERFHILIVKKLFHLLFFTQQWTPRFKCFWFILKLLLSLVFVMFLSC